MTSPGLRTHSRGFFSSGSCEYFVKNQDREVSLGSNSGGDFGG